MDEVEAGGLVGQRQDRIWFPCVDTKSAAIWPYDALRWRYFVNRRSIGTPLVG